MRTNKAHLLLIAATVIGIIAISIGSINYLNMEIARNKQYIARQMQSITDLKARDIARWRAASIGSAETVINNPIWIGPVRRLLEDPDKSAEIKTDILKWMESKRKVNDYKNVLLVRTDGTVVLTLNPEDTTIGTNMTGDIERCVSEKKIVMNDLHRGSKKFIHMDVLIPLVDTSDGREKVIALFWFRIDPDTYLYPLLNSWPVPSKSAETILLRREGERALFFNEPRFKEGASQKFSFPVAAVDTPSLMAVLGKEGLVDGTDYRGKKVLACIKKVHGSPWYILSKMDDSEVYEPVHKVVSRVFIFAILLTGFFILMMTLIIALEDARHEKMLRDESEKHKAIESHYSTIMKYANDMIFLLDDKWRIVEANDRAIECYGYSLDEFRKMDVSQIGTPESRDRFREDLENVERDGRGVFSTVHMRRNGSEFPAESSVRVIEVEGRRFYQDIVRDVSERKQSEEMLRSRKALLSYIINSMPAFVFWKDRRSAYLGCNEAFAKAAGVGDPDNIIGKTDYDLAWKKEEAEAFIKDDEAVMSTREAMLNREETQLQAGGKQAILLTNKVPLFGADGSVIGVLGIYTDITERKRMENSLKLAYNGLRDTQLELIQSEKLAAIGRFSTGIAHEVKNPIGIVLGGTEFLEKKLAGADEDTKTALSKIRDAAIRANDILQALLIYARPSALKPEKIDPVELINEVLSLVKYKDTFNNIAFDTYFAKEPMLIEVDKNQMQQVLFNIIRNAGESMPGGGRVAIRTYKEKFIENMDERQGCYIEVVDSGVGIPESAFRKLTEPFFTTKERKVGTGLGLFMAKTIIDNHKGRLLIESKPGAGTKVKVVLPSCQ